MSENVPAAEIENGDLQHLSTQLVQAIRQRSAPVGSLTMRSTAKPRHFSRRLRRLALPHHWKYAGTVGSPLQVIRRASARLASATKFFQDTARRSLPAKYSRPRTATPDRPSGFPASR